MLQTSQHLAKRAMANVSRTQRRINVAVRTNTVSARAASRPRLQVGQGALRPRAF